MPTLFSDGCVLAGVDLVKSILDPAVPPATVIANPAGGGGCLDANRALYQTGGPYTTECYDRRTQTKKTLDARGFNTAVCGGGRWLAWLAGTGVFGNVVVRDTAYIPANVGLIAASDNGTIAICPNRNSGLGYWLLIPSDVIDSVNDQGDPIYQCTIIKVEDGLPKYGLSLFAADDAVYTESGAPIGLFRTTKGRRLKQVSDGMGPSLLTTGDGVQWHTYYVPGMGVCAHPALDVTDPTPLTGYWIAPDDHAYNCVECVLPGTVATLRVAYAVNAGERPNEIITRDIDTLTEPRVPLVFTNTAMAALPPAYIQTIAKPDGTVPSVVNFEGTGPWLWRSVSNSQDLDTAIASDTDASLLPRLWYVDRSPDHPNGWPSNLTPAGFNAADMRGYQLYPNFGETADQFGKRMIDALAVVPLDHPEAFVCGTFDRRVTALATDTGSAAIDETTLVACVGVYELLIRRRSPKVVLFFCSGPGHAGSMDSYPLLAAAVARLAAACPATAVLALRAAPALAPLPETPVDPAVTPLPVAPVAPLPVTSVTLDAATAAATGAAVTGVQEAK